MSQISNELYVFFSKYHFIMLKYFVWKIYFFKDILWTKCVRCVLCDRIFILNNNIIEHVKQFVIHLGY